MKLNKDKYGKIKSCHFTVHSNLYKIFREECDKRAISMSKWLRKKIVEQLEDWE